MKSQKLWSLNLELPSHSHGSHESWIPRLMSKLYMTLQLQISSSDFLWLIRMPYTLTDTGLTVTRLKNLIPHMQNNQARRYCTALESCTKKQYILYCSDSNAWTTDWTLTVSYLHLHSKTRSKSRWTESAPVTLLTPSLDDESVTKNTAKHS